MTLIQKIKKTIFTNPIVMKELLLKFRYKRFFLISSSYVLFTFFAILFFNKTTDSYAYRAADFISWLTEAARGSFLFLSFWQFSILALITLTFSSSAISAEREQNTLALLLSSQLNAYMIIFGKFITAILYNLLTLTILLPLFSIIFVLGGITIPEILLSYILIFLGTSFFSAVAIFWSTIFKKTIMASLTSYFSAIVAVTGPLFIPYIIFNVFKLRKYMTVSYKDALIFLPQHFNPAFPLILMFEKGRVIKSAIFMRYSYKIFIATSCFTIILSTLIFLIVSAMILNRKLLKS